MRATLAERLLAKVRHEQRVEGMTLCWIWTASLDGKGYGQINLGRRMARAHRVAYELFVAKIEDPTLDLDHLCRVIVCCNPAHLELVTHRVNLMRGNSPPAINATKTHCPQGHEYTAANTYIYPRTGWRQCRPCMRAHQSRLHRARQAATA